MGWVSTISVFGFFGSTLPNALRAMPGFRSLVTFESMSNCRTFPCGTPSTTLRSGAGTYFGPMTKLPYASSGGFSPSFSTLKGGAPLSSYLRTGCAVATPGQARAATRMSLDSWDMNPRRFLGIWSYGSSRIALSTGTDVRKAKSILPVRDQFRGPITGRQEHHRGRLFGVDDDGKRWPVQVSIGQVGRLDEAGGEADGAPAGVGVRHLTPQYPRHLV